MQSLAEPSRKSEQRDETVDIAPGAMKCIVINLPRAEARREMSRQFDALGIEFEIFDAIDLREEDWVLVDRKSRKMEGRRPLSDGMIACHLSNRKVLKSISAGEDELTAVFEDAVTLTPEIGGSLDVLARLHASGWRLDFVFLHRQRLTKPFSLLKKADAGVRLGIIRFSDFGAFGYVASKEGTRRFLENCPQVVHQIDHTLHAYWESGLNVFSLEAPVVFHENEAGGHSFIQEAAKKQQIPGRAGTCGDWGTARSAISEKRRSNAYTFMERCGAQGTAAIQREQTQGGAVAEVLVSRDCGFLPQGRFGKRPPSPTRAVPEWPLRKKALRHAKASLDALK